MHRFLNDSEVAKEAEAERAQLAKQVTDVLARSVSGPEEAKMLAERAGFPSEYLPAFKTGATYWHAVVQQSLHGQLPLETLVATALDALPHNADLQALGAALGAHTASHAAPQQRHLGGRIHVCHAPEDIATADTVVEALRRAGLAPWVTRSQFTRPEALPKRIGETVGEASYVALLVSRASLGSGSTTWEWTASLEDKGSVLIPIRVDDFEVPLSPSAAPIIDLGANDIDDALSRLVDFFLRELDVVSFPTKRTGIRRALHGASRRELRLVAKHCLDSVALDEFLFDADIDPGMVEGQSVHARVVWLLHRVVSEGLLEFFAEWLEGERQRCVAHRLAMLRSGPG